MCGGVAERRQSQGEGVERGKDHVIHEEDAEGAIRGECVDVGKAG